MRYVTSAAVVASTRSITVIGGGGGSSRSRSRSLAASDSAVRRSAANDLPLPPPAFTRLSRLPDQAPDELLRRLAIADWPR